MTFRVVYLDHVARISGGEIASGAGPGRTGGPGRWSRDTRRARTAGRSTARGRGIGRGGSRCPRRPERSERTTSGRAPWASRPCVTLPDTSGRCAGACASCGPTWSTPIRSRPLSMEAWPAGWPEFPLSGTSGTGSLLTTSRSLPSVWCASPRVSFLASSSRTRTPPSGRCTSFAAASW